MPSKIGVLWSWCKGLWDFIVRRPKPKYLKDGERMEWIQRFITNMQENWWLQPFSHFRGSCSGKRLRTSRRRNGKTFCIIIWCQSTFSISKMAPENLPKRILKNEGSRKDLTKRVGPDFCHKACWASRNSAIECAYINIWTQSQHTASELQHSRPCASSVSNWKHPNSKSNKLPQCTMIQFWSKSLE